MSKKLYLLIFVIVVANISIHAQSLKRSVVDGKVDSVWQGINLPQGYTGKDVIIGITDWGFDYTHPVFYDTTLTHNRILRVWDMFRSDGTPPDGFNYGVEYNTTEDILAAQHDTFNVYQYGYHGTHVASIAAGSGGGSEYRGVAYGADLLLATFLVNEQAVIDAFNWMYQVAQAEHKRLVINMSWGLYYMGNIDGSGQLAKTMDSLSDLGVVFVTSAGNNGDVNFHISQNFAQQTDTLRTQITFYGGEHAALWGQSVSMTNSAMCPFQFSMHFLNTDNERIAQTPLFSTLEGNNYIDTFQVIGEDTVFYNVNIEQENAYNQRPQVRLRVKKLTFNNVKVCLSAIADSGIFHAWNVVELSNDVGNWGNDFQKPYSSNLYTAGDAYYGIGTPANVECVISVAAYRPSFTVNGRVIGGEIASFSSFGGIIDGRRKPDVAAPGVSIISAISSFTNTFSGTTTTTVTFNNKKYPFAALSGTSMSSPFTAGVCALILEANKYLTPQQVKNILEETAYQDNYTQSSGIERFGYGKVNAYQAVKKALEMVNIDENPYQNKLFIYPNPAAESLCIQSDRIGQNAALYNVIGQKVKDITIESSHQIIDIKYLPKGMYILKFDDNQIAKIIKE